jgi:hypothetical protein
MRFRVAVFSGIMLALMAASTKAEGHNRFCRIREDGGGATDIEDVIVYGRGDGFWEALAGRAGIRRPTSVLVDGWDEFLLALRDVRRRLGRSGVLITNVSVKPDPGLIQLTKKPR